jgi:hypothetical protein
MTCTALELITLNLLGSKQLVSASMVSYTKDAQIVVT